MKYNNTYVNHSENEAILWNQPVSFPFLLLPNVEVYFSEMDSELIFVLLCSIFKVFSYIFCTIWLFFSCKKFLLSILLQWRRTYIVEFTEKRKKWRKKIPAGSFFIEEGFHATLTTPLDTLLDLLLMVNWQFYQKIMKTRALSSRRLNFKQIESIEK